MKRVSTRAGREVRAIVAAGALAVGLVEGRTAWADEAADAVAAQALFDQGKALMAKKQWAEACGKLEESERLQPAGGTLLFLALCREGEGKTATAWATFNEVVSVARRTGRADREKVALQHLDALTPNLMKLTIVVGSAAAIEGLEVRRDGVVVPRALWGSAVPVDPGHHTLTASAPGWKPWEGGVDVSKPAETITAEIPALERAPEPEPVASTAPAPVVVAPPTPVPLPAEAPSTSPRRTIALVVGGVGAAGLAVGTVFGVLALDKKHAADASCPGGSSGPCYAAGVHDSKTAVTDGNVSTVAFVAGGALVAGAAALWITAPKPSRTGARLAPFLDASTAGIGVSGRFE